MHEIWNAIRLTFAQTRTLIHVSFSRGQMHAPSIWKDLDLVTISQVRQRYLPQQQRLLPRPLEQTP